MGQIIHLVNKTLDGNGVRLVGWYVLGGGAPPAWLAALLREYEKQGIYTSNSTMILGSLN